MGCSMSTSRKWALIISMILLPVIHFGCEDENRAAFGSKGRTMEIHAESPRVVDKAFFVDKQGNTRILVPGASNRQLVVVEVTVVNRISTVIPFVVDEDGAQLGDRRAKRYGAIDPFEKSRPYSGIMEESKDVMDIAPILWGETDLARKFQVAGNIVFDVPKGTILGTLFWDDVEYIPVDFLDYWKGFE